MWKKCEEITKNLKLTTTNTARSRSRGRIRRTRHETTLVERPSGRSTHPRPPGNYMDTTLTSHYPSFLAVFYPLPSFGRRHPRESHPCRLCHPYCSPQWATLSSHPPHWLNFGKVSDTDGGAYTYFLILVFVSKSSSATCVRWSRYYAGPPRQCLRNQHGGE